MMNDFVWSMIYKICSGDECLILEFERHWCFGKEWETNLHNMTMFTLSWPILLMGMRTWNLMCYAYFGEERVQFLLLSSPVTLHTNDFPIKHSFNKSIKFMKFLNHLWFKLEQINSSKFTIVIHKTYIILVPSNGLGRWAPNIRKN
jgi:hypothetical protein